MLFLVITLSCLFIKEITEILSILAACLHLGNIEFDEVGDDTDGVAIRDDDSLRHGKQIIYTLIFKYET